MNPAQALGKKYEDYTYTGETVDGTKILTGDISAGNPEYYASGQFWVAIGLSLIIIGFCVALIVKKCKKGI